MNEADMPTLELRVLALETYLKGCVDALAKLDEELLARSKELRALELTKAKYDVEHWLPEMEERNRVTRWHATRDAILPAIYAEALNHGMNLDEVLHDAALYADAAHGPLKVKP